MKWVADSIAAAEEASHDLSGIWESFALVGALSAGALVMTMRRKNKRASASTHWAVLLSAHGGLVAVFHVTTVVFHISGALVLAAMAERVIWEVSDGLAERIDKFIDNDNDEVSDDDGELVSQ